MKFHTPTTASAVVRVQLALLLPAALLLIGLATGRRGAWLVLLLPAALILTRHARQAARVRPHVWGSAMVNTGLILAAAIFATLVLGPALGLYRTVTVLSGSMHPTFNAGDVIVVTPAPPQSLRLGDVITYQIPVHNEQVETHRVVRILEQGRRPIIQTKGDANTSPDPWTARLDGGPIWRYQFRLPLAGYPILALRNPLTQKLLTVLLPALLALYALARLWLPTRPLQPGEQHARSTS
jgi:signal peptidase